MKKTLASIAAISIMIGCAPKQPAKTWQSYDAVLEQIKAPVFPDKQFDITNYGAKAGEVSTKAINDAIIACNAQGGGVVVVPEGEFFTGPIVMLSNVNLHISKGAVLKFSTEPKDYLPGVVTRWEGVDCVNLSPLIYAKGQENVAVTGEGILDGQSSMENWWIMKSRQMTIKEEDGTTREGGRARLFKMMADSIPLEERVLDETYELRPPFIQFYQCKNILIEGITIHRAPFWLIHPVFSENITVRKVIMESHGPNNDGCDPESCKNVLIEDCYFNTGDDCIAIKSGRNEDGRFWNVPSENIIVRNNIMKDGHAGVAIGSEISGGYRNLWVENCNMDSPNLDRAIRIKSNAIRGGHIENVYVRNITIGECKQTVFLAEMKYERVTEGSYLPSIRNVYMENVTSQKSRYGVLIDDLPQGCVQDVYIKNCSFNGVTNENLNIIPETLNIVFDNVTINGEPFVLNK
jgi:Endopolygalacturonase